MSYLRVSRARQYPVPSAAVLRHVDRWTEQQPYRCEDAPLGLLSPTQVIAERSGMPHNTVQRTLHRLRHESERCSIRVADQFLAAIREPDAWHHDPDLACAFALHVVDEEEDMTDQQIAEWAVVTVGDMSRMERARLRRQLAWLIPAPVEAAA